ncbi:MAG: SDR family oxidoreductase [Alphaproteobacteria bacterium]|nr:MAG: SDR family oxidoreductase [Alphaproteobacteria bacterium]
MNLDLEGKVAFVTGSNRGTGAEIARALAGEGAEVVLHGLGEEPGPGEIDLMTTFGRELPIVRGDIRTDEGANKVASELEALGLEIDILVNNFGAAIPGRWRTSSIAKWIEAFEANLFSAVRMVRLATRAMKEKGWGRIIQVGTIGSTSPNSRMPAYYTAKAALAASTISLMKDLADTGITVNTVSPGLILTPEVEKYYMSKASHYGGGATWDEIEQSVTKAEMPNPLGRIARREEIAALICFLASPKAGFINGQNIRVDGGALGTVE